MKKTLLTLALVATLILASCNLNAPIGSSAPAPAPVQPTAAQAVSPAAIQPAVASAVPVVEPTAQAVAPVNSGAPANPALPSGTLVQPLTWTDPMAPDNIVYPDAIVARPDKGAFDVHITNVDTSKVYQLKTDFDDTNLSTWKAGIRLYEFGIPKGFQPVFVGVQGDSAVVLCWEAEENGSGMTQILMKTLSGNGTSAFVTFQAASNFPPVGQRCSASK